VRAYGAGILSSFGELQYALSKEPKLLPWDPFEAAKLEFPITTYQPVYFVAEDFKDATAKFREFMTTLDPPFQLKYNPAARRIKVLAHEE
jgi:phenylalanine-4-hydroxylase